MAMAGAKVRARARASGARTEVTISAVIERSKGISAGNQQFSMENLWTEVGRFNDLSTRPQTGGNREYRKS